MSAEPKTRPTATGVDAFIDAISEPGKQADARRLRAMMERLSGYPATMWGPSIIGFGRYAYVYESGHSGEWMRLGFSPRATALSLYFVDGFEEHRPLLDRLGKHRIGKSCLYAKRLADLDEDVLEALIRASLSNMRIRYPDGA